MNQKPTLVTVGMAVVLAVAISPMLVGHVNADPAPKQDVEDKCSDPKFADRESCPGASEDARSNHREDVQTCTPRNPGQAKDCPDGSEIQDPVNP